MPSGSAGALHDTSTVRALTLGKAASTLVGGLRKAVPAVANPLDGATKIARAVAVKPTTPKIAKATRAKRWSGLSR